MERLPYNEALRKAGDAKIDLLCRAILQLRITGYRATAIVRNPIDWADMALVKDSASSYIWGSVQKGGQPRIWRLPVVDTSALSQGKIMDGAFGMASKPGARKKSE